ATAASSLSKVIVRAWSAGVHRTFGVNVMFLPRTERLGPFGTQWAGGGDPVDPPDPEQAAMTRTRRAAASGARARLRTPLPTLPPSRWCPRARPSDEPWFEPLPRPTATPDRSSSATPGLT